MLNFILKLGRLNSVESFVDIHEESLPKDVNILIIYLYNKYLTMQLNKIGGCN